MLEEIVESDGEAGELEDVGHHGHRGEVLKVPDADQEADRDQGEGHVDSVVNITEIHRQYLEHFQLSVNIELL